MTKAMNWCVTIQLKDEEDAILMAKRIFALFAAELAKPKARKNTLPPLDRFRYFGFGLECGKATKNWHFQCYLQCLMKQTLNALICFFSADGSKKTKWGVHLTAARGSPQENYDYITKECGVEKLNEIGQIKMEGQGSRSDIHAVAKAIMGGANIDDIAKMAPHMIIKYPGGCKTLIAIKQRQDVPKHRDVKVYVFWGPTRSGKTWTASDGETHPSYHMRKGVEWAGNKKMWWPNYMGEQRLIIDDFQPSHMSLGDCMALMDRDRQTLDAKNGGKLGAWTELFLTSNKPYPHMWYTNADQGRREALFERVDVAIEFTKHWREQTPVIYDSDSSEDAMEVEEDESERLDNEAGELLAGLFQ